MDTLRSLSESESFDNLIHFLKNISSIILLLFFSFIVVVIIGLQEHVNVEWKMVEVISQAKRASPELRE